MTALQESELVKNILQGSRQAENELFNLFIEKITWKVRTMLGSSNDDWKDVAGECMMAVLVSLRKGKLDLNKGNMGTYIFGVTRNKIRDYYKLKKRKGDKALRIDELSEKAVAINAEPEIEKKEFQGNVLSIINQLPPKYGEVLKLCYLEELSIKEAGQKLNIPPEEVSRRLWYGKQLLRNKYKNDDFL
jgi:RNA polymerase sigma-70 factor (ECF subfamily)